MTLLAVFDFFNNLLGKWGYRDPVQGRGRGVGYLNGNEIAGLRDGVVLFPDHRHITLRVTHPLLPRLFGISLD